MAFGHDHNTINTFRSTRLKDAINQIFTQVALLLVEMGHLSLDVVYLDGTKMESRANRYTFVWRKTVEKNKAKLVSSPFYNVVNNTYLCCNFKNLCHGKIYNSSCYLKKFKVYAKINVINFIINPLSVTA